MAVTIVQCTVPNLSALEVVRAVSHVRGAGDVVVDLAAVRFARPADLTVLLSQLQRLVDLGYRCRLIRPIDDDVARYLTRMDVAEWADGSLVEHDLPPIRRRDTALDGDILVPLTQFTSQDHVTDAVSLVGRRVESPPLRQRLALMLAEAGNNVPDHARVHHGFLMAQYFRKSSELCLAVADAGVGVLATLRPRGATTDAEAVDMALVGTSELGPERGRGLPSLVEALAGTGGTGSLWSGSARVRLDGHRPAVAAPSLQGTLVSFTVSSGAPRSSRPSPSNGYHEW